MAIILQTPQLIAQNAFDPSHEHNFDFLYDGNQIIKSRLVITDNETSSIVYDKTKDGMRLYHPLSANELSPGHSYLAQIQVFDADGNESNLSDAMLFYCFSTPTYSISGISDNEILRKATLEVEFNYSQTENEPLQTYQFYLYNSDGSISQQSDILYDSSPRAYTFYSLSNEKSYSVKITGRTSHGLEIDTGLIHFSVQMQLIPANIVFKVANNYNGGYTTLTANIIDIGYILDNDNYTISDGMLTLNNNKLTYNDGFSIDSDFILFVEAKKLPLGKPFLLLNDIEISLEIKNICGNYYCCLNIPYVSQYAELPKERLVSVSEDYITTTKGNVIQIINTEYQDDDLVVFELKRVNGIYGLSAYYKSDVYTDKNNILE